MFYRGLRVPWFVAPQYISIEWSGGQTVIKKNRVQEMRLPFLPSKLYHLLQRLMSCFVCFQKYAFTTGWIGRAQWLMMVMTISWCWCHRSSNVWHTHYYCIYTQYYLRFNESGGLWLFYAVKLLPFFFWPAHIVNSLTYGPLPSSLVSLTLIFFSIKQPTITSIRATSI